MQHTMDLTSIRSIRDLKAKLAAAEILFDAKAFKLEPGKNKIELYAWGTFIEARSGDPIFIHSSFAAVKRIGYNNLVLQADPDEPDKTYRAHMDKDPMLEYAFKICVIS